MMVNLKDRFLICLILVFAAIVLWPGCSGDDGPCDALCHAEKLDEELAGEGKISLIERESDIEKLISAYTDTLSVCSGTQAREVNGRIGDLEFEKELVEAIREALETIREEVEEGAQFRLDVQLYQATLRETYMEAAFYPLNENISSDLYEGPSVAPDKPTSDYTVWFIISYSTPPEEIPDWFEEDVLYADDLTGYDLTHQYACLFIQRLRWTDYDFGDKWSEKVDELAHRIAVEQAAVPLDVDGYSIDLYAERLYSLLDAGYLDLVRREWLERLLADRLPSGVWPRNLGDEEPRWHATHLAIMSLSKYQVMLQRGEERLIESFP